MSNQSKPASSSSSSQISTPLTAANLAAHQRAIAASSSTTKPQGGWVCGGEMNHRRAPPNPEQWDELVERDPLAAEIEAALRAASKEEKDRVN
jgi:hypothetical protein